MSKEKPVIFISISTGWAVRNFFQTGIIDKLKDNFKIVVFTTPVIYENLLEKSYGDGIEFIVLDKSAEPLKWRLFRQLKKKIYMEGRKSNTESIWEKYVKRPFYQKIGGNTLKAILHLFDANLLLNRIENIDFKLNEDKGLSNYFLSYKPAVFFATHASTFFEESLLHSSVNHKIPTVFMVLSWDHLSSKVILSRKYDTIFVWNKITKSEILETCPSYKEEQIKIVGVPQYDIYAEKPKISYEHWCQKYGLDKDKRTILFSTMPQVRHNQQHIILEELLIEIAKGKKLPRDLQVLIKCHPFDNTDKYDSLLDKYTVSICRTKLPYGVPQDNWFPSEDEMYIGRDALYFSDININIFSTVTLEAAFFDKPVIHIAFDPEPVTNRIPCKEYYNFEHFKNIVNTGASIMVYGFEELYGAINVYLKDPGFKSSQRKKLLEEYFTVNPGQASNNVVDKLKDHLNINQIC